MYTIRICCEQPGFQPLTLKNIAAGSSLLEVCLSHQIALQHQCGGVCACSTCRLLVIEGMKHLEGSSRREEHLIAKTGSRQSQLRLACQCLLLEGEGYVEIRLPQPAM